MRPRPGPHNRPPNAGGKDNGIDCGANPTRGERMGYHVLDFHDIDRSQVAIVGGKGGFLGELSQIEGVAVPTGFCVTTDGFRRILAGTPSIADRLERLSSLPPDDHEAIHTLSAGIRRAIETTAVPQDLAAAVTRALARDGEQAAYAVRSSATAEDSPTASFAGQYDTYLNVTGSAAILQHISRCWASLFTERAVSYRLRHGFDHQTVRMAVVVQRMVNPDAAGVLFTADPVTGNRKVAAVEAGRGLGEGLVAGQVNADVYKVRGDEVVAKALRHDAPALTDAQVVGLVALGRRIEAHLGHPQDIEWCFANRAFWIVQTRPITTLFPIPQASDADNHVYVSVGHQQMMTDAMKPLGLSVWQLTALIPMHDAGGRLFVDVTERLASPATRDGLLTVLGSADPLLADALQTILQRGDLIPTRPHEAPDAAVDTVPPSPIETDQTIVAQLIERSEISIATLTREISTKSGAALLDFILDDIQELKRLLVDPLSRQALMAGMQATSWLNDRLQAWLGEKNAADILSRSVPNNVTSEMGLALLDVADVIRPHSEVVTFLAQVEDDDFLDELARLAGGRQAQAAIQAFLDRYGMRGAGEIDITRPRWSECPSTLITAILANVKNFQPGEAARHFDEGRRQAAAKERELLEQLRLLPGGGQKAAETKQMIDRLRTFIGYREYPKYGIVSRHFIYKQALMREAKRLVDAEVLGEPEDVFYLTLGELHHVVSSHQADEQLIRQRRTAFRSHRALAPPRVLTSDGEVFAGAYRRDDLPDGALIGLPVSAGVIEGTARVVGEMADADLEAGDILVTTYADPSWTPLFLAVRGLVTEIGGPMTHGSVIAREYGLPAVVGVERATERIRDGQRIRVHGTDGYVEIL